MTVLPPTMHRVVDELARGARIERVWRGGRATYEVVYDWRPERTHRRRIRILDGRTFRALQRRGVVKQVDADNADAWTLAEGWQP